MGEAELGRGGSETVLHYGHHNYTNRTMHGTMHFRAFTTFHFHHAFTTFTFRLVILFYWVVLRVTYCRGVRIIGLYL